MLFNESKDLTDSFTYKENKKKRESMCTARSERKFSFIEAQTGVDFTSAVRLYSTIMCINFTEFTDQRTLKRSYFSLGRGAM